MSLLPPPFPELLLLSTMACGMEYPFSQFGSAVLVVSALNLLPTPRGRSKSLKAVQALFSNSWNAGVLPAPLGTNAKHRTIQAAVRKVTPAQPDPVLYDDSHSWMRLCWKKINPSYWRGHFLNAHLALMQKIVLLHVSRLHSAVPWLVLIQRCHSRNFSKYSWCIDWSRWPLGYTGAWHLWVLLLESFHTLFCGSYW